MGAEILVVYVLPALLLMAAVWDLASYTIPNHLQVVLIGGFAVFVVVAGMPLHVAGAHLAAGVIGLVAGFALFARGYIGGGDAKLFAGVVLWLGFGDLMTYAVVASLIGGGLTLGLLLLRRVPLPAGLAGQAWLLRLHDPKAGVPYGVALAAGAILVLPQTEIFRLAAAA